MSIIIGSQNEKGKSAYVEELGTIAYAIQVTSKLLPTVHPVVLAHLCTRTDSTLGSRGRKQKPFTTILFGHAQCIDIYIQLKIGGK